MRVSVSFVLLCFHVPIVSSRSWSESTGGVPVIQVKLAPPKQQLPEISAETNGLQSLREELETVYLEKLQSAYARTLEQARVQINEIVDVFLGLIANSRAPPKGAASFLKVKDHQGSHAASDGIDVKVNVAQVAAPSAATSGLIEQIENSRANTEKAMFEQACAEMQGLTDIVLHELGAALHSYSAALRRADQRAAWIQTRQEHTLPAVANVKVAASSVPFARVSDLVEAMEVKRDVAEQLERKKIVALELKLLEAENSMIKEAIGSAARKIMAS